MNVSRPTRIQYIPRNMHTVFALLCFVVVIHWLIFPYPSGLLHWHCGNLTIAPVPAKQPWWIWINASCEFIMNDCITTTKQSTTKPCAYFLGYTVYIHPTTPPSLQPSTHKKNMRVYVCWVVLGEKFKFQIRTIQNKSLNVTKGNLQWISSVVNLIYMIYDALCDWSLYIELKHWIIVKQWIFYG